MATKSTVQSTLSTRVADIEAQIEDLQAKLEQIQLVPLDTFADGEVVVFEKKFNADGVTYTYAAVKANGLWYLTNRTSSLTWEDLMDIIFARIGAGGSVACWAVAEYVAI